VGWEIALKSPDELREQARHFRQLASGISDRRTLEAITELSAEYEAVATAIERLKRIRERAYQIWEEQGRPDGLHADHWRDAEQELIQNEGGGTDARETIEPRRPSTSAQ
jgi:hypothetical protein